MYSAKCFRIYTLSLLNKNLRIFNSLTKLGHKVWQTSNNYDLKISLFSCSVVSNSATPWTAAHQDSLSFTISLSLLKLMSIECVMPSNLLILCRRLLLLPSIFRSIRVFYNELALPIRWPKYWSLSFSIGPSNDY